MKQKFEIFHINELSVTIKLGNEISQDKLNEVMFLKQTIEKQNWAWLIECVPAYVSVSIFVSLDFFRIHSSLIDYIEDFLSKNNFESLNEIYLKLEPKQIEVRYDGEDLEFVADFTKIAKKQLIEMHTEPIYTVAMIGFLPGFPYLIGMNPKLFVPRKSNPRQKVQQGSVAIAGIQTGIYPMQSPGGWQIIGKTETEIFSIDKLSYLSIGEKVKFISV